MEVRINKALYEDFVEVNYKVADALKEIGEKSKGDILIAITHDIAGSLIEGNEEEELVCPTCHKTMKDDIEKDFLVNNGECIGCEHVRADIAPEDLYDFSEYEVEDAEVE
jgi:hypothetical protein